MLTAKKRSILLIAYFYPPLGGPAVQRPAKTVKYLTKSGWDVDVITIKDIVYHSTDESLNNECTHRNIIRTASFDLMYLLNLIKKITHLNSDKLYFHTSQSKKNLIRRLFPIDEKIGWVPYIIKAGIKAIKENRYNYIFVTCGPFSSSIAASYLARRFNIPLIVDYRDHWTLNNTVIQPGTWIFKRIQHLEQKLLNRARLVLTATGYMKTDLAARFGQHLNDKILPFYNGWDEADFTDKIRQRKQDGKIRISYIGTLYGERPIKYFINALNAIKKEQPDIEPELWMVGNFYPETVKEIKDSGFLQQTTFIKQQSHSDAIQLMIDSDILLLIIGGKKNKWILTGKLFEYLRSRRPIITLAPKDSEAGRILNKSGHTHICEINQSAEIKAALESLINIVQSDAYNYTIPYEYERFNQVNNLHNLISKLPDNQR